MMDRFGFTDDDASASAISRTVIEPEPSSSAPLLMESRRAPWSAWRLSVMVRTRVCCAAVSVAGRGLSAPCTRATMLNARMESWSTGLLLNPMWSLWAPIATYSLRSTGSLPRSTAITLRPGACAWCSTSVPSSGRPAVPGATPSAAAPNIWVATRGVTNTVGGPAGGVPAAVSAVRRETKRCTLGVSRSSDTMTTAAARPYREVAAKARIGGTVDGTVSTTIFPAAASPEIHLAESAADPPWTTGVPSSAMRSSRWV